MLWGNRPFFSSVVGQRKGPNDAPPIHGIKKMPCLNEKNLHDTIFVTTKGCSPVTRFSYIWEKFKSF
jgi:hypothetical protein